MLYSKNHDNFEINISIPKVIYLSYKTKEIPEYIIPNIEKIYPDYEIKLFDNNDCINFLQKEYGTEYVDIFNYLKDGPIKADFWRICILYKYGGIYFDLDLEHFTNLNNIIDNDTYFVTVKTDKAFWDVINPCIIISKSNNDILKECIDKYLDKYNQNIPYEYWEYSIVHIMTDVLLKKINNISKDGIYYDNDKNKYQFLLEYVPEDISKSYCEYNNIKICNSRYKNYDLSNHTF